MQPDTSSDVRDPRQPGYAAPRSSNPALSDKAFAGPFPDTGAGVMTISGVVWKTFVLVLLAVASGAYAWNLVTTHPEYVFMALIAGTIGGLIVALIAIFKPASTPVTAPLYALLEGLVLGVISKMYEVQYGGIVLQAVGLTVCVLLVMMFLYTSGIVKVTARFRSIVIGATVAIALFYLVSFIVSLFGGGAPLVTGNSVWAIGFSVVVVLVAASNILLDLDFIDRGAKAGAPKYMEWYGSFGLLVTLVWLYLEILRLLGKLRR